MAKSGSGGFLKGVFVGAVVSVVVLGVVVNVLPHVQTSIPSLQGGQPSKDEAAAPEPAAAQETAPEPAAEPAPQPAMPAEPGTPEMGAAGDGGMTPPPAEAEAPADAQPAPPEPRSQSQEPLQPTLPGGPAEPAANTLRDERVLLQSTTAEVTKPAASPAPATASPPTLAQDPGATPQLGQPVTQGVAGLANPDAEEGRTLPSLGGTGDALPTLGRSAPSRFEQTDRVGDVASVGDTQSTAMPSIAPVENILVAEPVDEPAAEAPQAAPSFARFDANRQAFTPLSGKAVLALVVEAGDAPQSAAGGIIAASVPLAVAIDPRNERGGEVAATFAAAGLEVVALLDNSFEAEFRASGAPVALLETTLETLPNAIGAVTRFESELLKNKKEVSGLVEVLADEGLGLLYHRGFGSNAIQGQADRYSLPLGQIDRAQLDAGSKEQIVETLDKAAFQIGQSGATIVYLKYSADLAPAILEWSQGARAETVQFAPVSALMQ